MIPTTLKTLFSRHQEYSVDDVQSYKNWVLHYQCSKGECLSIAKELHSNGWEVFSMELDDGTYKAVKSNIDLLETIEYVEEFKKKLEISMASLYPANKV